MKQKEKILTTLEQINDKLDEQGRKLDEDNLKLDEHGKRFEEQQSILVALRSGQEHLKAEIDGMRMDNAKEFDHIKKELNNVNLNFSVLRDDVWANKKVFTKQKSFIPHFNLSLRTLHRQQPL
ncbi:hypothetical protein JNUCC74_16095 [Cerasibacillus sp. JNUCC 74]|jgi:septal ring factor EnvC (AmiA/AmiB activator)|uniref:hypothetical protein n=1 Tax=Virgibacillus proomii TaxID=84407 RepID=UPI000985007B|nr:hypothetical protein [Virgibacillus proomii]